MKKRKLTHFAESQVEIFIWLVLPLVFQSGRTHTRTEKITRTHRSAEMWRMDKKRKEPYTHTHTSTQQHSSCCLLRNFFFYSIPFFFFYSLFFFFLRHTHNTTRNHGNEATARPEGSLTNELLIRRAERLPVCVYVWVPSLFSFRQKILPLFFFLFSFLCRVS